MRKLKITEMGRMNAEEFKASEKMPLIVVLDDVRSMYNVGSVFRTADAFRVEAIYLCGITAQPPHPEIHKTALGAEDTVAWQYFPTALDAVHALKQQGYTVYSIEQCEGSTPLQTLQTLPSPSLQGGGGISANENTNEQSNYSLPAGRVRGGSFALILGNEVKGVHQEVVDASDGCIEIPQYGTKHSLNVSTTAGIVIWEFAKRLLM
ncbi:MAG: RNA methyltransferase [Prevotellaceae bacterium]|nr:RNA methyltransferase [Prevotellaceae bacterium]